MRLLFFVLAAFTTTVQASDDVTMRSVLRGQQLFVLCANCHTASPDGHHRVGPNLYGILGRKIAAVPDFSYSPALTTETGVWTAARLDEFLQRPNHAVPGTDMSFRGLHNPSDRQDIINWLALQSDGSPLPPVEDTLPETLLKGDAARGWKLFQPCMACHSYEEGKPHEIGPNLHGLMGRQIASAKGFHYSEFILRQKGRWTPERLNAFIFEKKRFAQGSHMAFHSVIELADRADLIAWLETISPDYKPEGVSEANDR